MRDSLVALDLLLLERNYRRGVLGIVNRMTVVVGDDSTEHQGGDGADDAVSEQELDHLQHEGNRGRESDGHSNGATDAECSDCPIKQFPPLKSGERALNSFDHVFGLNSR